MANSGKVIETKVFTEHAGGKNSKEFRRELNETRTVYPSTRMVRKRKNIFWSITRNKRIYKAHGW